MSSDTGGVAAFSIQGRLYRERERLSFGGMTEEERLLRKQWVADQVLSECEPVEVPELIQAKTNIFKRIYRKPLDVLVYDRLKNRMNPFSALIVRNIIGKSLMLIGSIYATTYYFKYNQNDWTRKGGFRVLTNRPTCLPGETCYNKVKYDPSQEESYELSKISCEKAVYELSVKPLSSENEQLTEESNAKEPGDEKYQATILENSSDEKDQETIPENFIYLEQVLVNKADNTESDKSDSNVYTSCPTVDIDEVVEPSPPPKERKDKGPLYRSLGSYYASRGFENSPI